MDNKVWFPLIKPTEGAVSVLVSKALDDESEGSSEMVFVYHKNDGSYEQLDGYNKITVKDNKFHIDTIDGKFNGRVFDLGV